MKILSGKLLRKMCLRCLEERSFQQIMKSELIENGEEGTAVLLGYRKGKYPEVDYWELAKKTKARLDALGYRVM